MAADLSPRRRLMSPRVRMTLALWSVGLALFAIGALMLGRGRAEPWLPLWLAAIAASGVALCGLLYLLQKSLHALAPAGRVAALTAAALATALIQSMWDHLVWSLFVIRSGSDFRLGSLDGVIFNAMMYLWIFGLYVAGDWLLGLAARTRSQEEQIARAQATAAQAQLAAMRYQVNPRLLFGALSSAGRLVAGRRNAEAEAVVRRLSDFLRHSLDADPSATTTLEDELAGLEDYLALLGAAAGRRLELEVDCPEALRPTPLPAHLLQPLAEALLAGAEADATLRIAVSTRDESLLIALDCSSAARRADWLQPLQVRLRAACPGTDLQVDGDESAVLVRLPQFSKAALVSQ